MLCAQRSLSDVHPLVVSRRANKRIDFLYVCSPVGYLSGVVGRPIEVENGNVSSSCQVESNRASLRAINRNMCQLPFCFARLPSRLYFRYRID